MNLSARYDIEAPVDFVYRELTDFDGWELMAARRGAKVTRTSGVKAPGLEWQVSFPFRGKARNARLHLAAATPTSHMTVSAVSKMVDGNLTFDLLDLAATRTRIEVRMVVKPKTLAARIYVQTLRLARKKMEATFSQRVAQFAVDLEDRYRRPLAKKV
jgi:hypothetical protein